MIAPNRDRPRTAPRIPPRHGPNAPLLQNGLRPTIGWGLVVGLLLGLVYGLLGLSAAHADSSVRIWGFQRGCERMPDVDRALERALFKQGLPVGLLQGPNGEPLPACQGERCAQLVTAACPGTPGRLLGGQVVQRDGLIKVRLWLVDLENGQVAYQDDYCESCNLLSALTAQTRTFLRAPNFGGPPAPAPSYCSASPGAAAAPATAPTTATAAGPLFLLVYGDGKHRPQLVAALKSQLEQPGRPVQLVSAEGKTANTETLQRIVAGHNGAQVFAADVQKEGRVMLYLYDQTSELTNAQSVDCPDCQKDVNSLVGRVQAAVAPLLGRCFGTQCAGHGRPPVAACEPFVEPLCPDLDVLSAAIASAPRPRRSVATLDAGTATLIKGLTWGAFAASSATALGLAIANPFVVQESAGLPFAKTLTAPAWTAAALSAGVLAVAIPITVAVNRAQSRSQPTAAARPPSASPILCPSP